jgi:predicted peptidase
VVQEWSTSLEIAKALQEHPERFPALVLMPRLPTGAYWTPLLPGTWAPDAVTRRTSDTVGVVELDAAIDAVLAGYSVDRTRISLTGKSLGGGGTYGFAALHPDRFSAIVPIAGFGSAEQARAVASLPAWVFHGDADTTIPPDHAQRMVRAIKDAGGSVRFTEYRGVGHDAEVERRTYGDPRVITWLLAQRRSTMP